MTRLSTTFAPKYLVRIDDICPTMNWTLWDQIEQIFLENNVRPILAVVPDSRDIALHFAAPRQDFWDRVRRWQALGWTIGLHGFQHVYVTDCRGLVGINRFSEFAGVPLDEQRRKIKAGLAIFERERVEAQLWVAPAHTFDSNTVEALYQVGLNTISDGFGLTPYVDARGMFWIPQQLGKFRQMPGGVWTVCMHLEDPIYCDLVALRRNIQKYRSSIVDVEQVKNIYGNSRRGLVNAGFAHIMRWSKRAARSGNRPSQPYQSEAA